LARADLGIDHFPGGGIELDRVGISAGRWRTRRAPSSDRGPLRFQPDSISVRELDGRGLAGQASTLVLVFHSTFTQVEHAMPAMGRTHGQTVGKMRSATRDGFPD
jgi:hypothetical protein